MINAPFATAKTNHVCIQCSVCVCVCTGTKESLSPQVNDIICPGVGLWRPGIRSVCVCCFLCNVCVIYHFSHEKRETNTHQLSHSHVSVHRVKVNNQWTCYIFVISVLDSSFMSILLCNSGLEKLNLVFAHCSSMFDKRSPVSLLAQWFKQQSVKRHIAHHAMHSGVVLLVFVQLNPPVSVLPVHVTPQL